MTASIFSIIQALSLIPSPVNMHMFPVLKWQSNDAL